MFDQLSHVVAEASGWAYVVVFLFALIDAMLPVVPSETAVITAGVVAAGGDLLLPIAIGAAFAGAFVGDVLTYVLGRRYGVRVTNRFFRSAKAQRRIDWTKRQLEQRGGELIAVARFIPGGRTVVTLTAGIAHFPWPRFAVFDAIAACIWAGYAGLLGYFGGQAFEHQVWKGLVFALGIALAVTLGTEGVRWLLHHRRRQPGPVGTDAPQKVHAGMMGGRRDQ